jgi:hypothetical protein
MERQHLFVSCFPPLVKCGAQARIGNERKRRVADEVIQSRGWCHIPVVWAGLLMQRRLLLQHRSSAGVKFKLVPTEYAFDDVSQVLEHMKAIRHLHGQWRGAANSFGVRASSVASHKLNR